MKKQNPKDDSRHILVGLAAFIIVVAGVRAVAPLLDQVLLAIIIALTLSPLLRWITAKGGSHTMAVVITILVAVIGGLLLAGMFGVALAGLIKNLPAYTSEFSRLKLNFEDYLLSKGIDSSVIMGATPDPSALVGIGTQMLASISAALGTFLIVLVIAALMLAEGPMVMEELTNHKNISSDFMEKIYKIRIEVMRYLSLLSLMNLMIAAGNTVAFFIIGADYALVWGVLSFFFAFVPYIGFIIYAVPPALLVLMEKDWIPAIILVGVLFGINFVVDNVVKPFFLKGGFNISFLLIILSFIFWGYIFGA
ncbi:MAG: AI-2E family transporter, partial [Chitinophagales bacterium]